MNKIKIKIRTRIFNDGWHNPLDHSHKTKYFATREMYNDKTREWESLPNFPTDDRLDRLRKQEWFNEIGELVEAGNNLRDIRSSMNIKSSLIAYKGSYIEQ